MKCCNGDGGSLHLKELASWSSGRSFSTGEQISERHLWVSRARLEERLTTQDFRGLGVDMNKYQSRCVDSSARETKPLRGALAVFGKGGAKRGCCPDDVVNNVHLRCHAVNKKL